MTIYISHIGNRSILSLLNYLWKCVTLARGMLSQRKRRPRRCT